MHCSFNTYVNAFLAKARFINFWSNYFLNVLSTLLPTQLTLLFVKDLFGTLKGNSCICLHEQLNSLDSNSNWCYRSYAFILIHYDSKKLWFFLGFFSFGRDIDDLRDDLVSCTWHPIIPFWLDDGLCIIRCVSWKTRRGSVQIRPHSNLSLETSKDLCPC